MQKIHAITLMAILISVILVGASVPAKTEVDPYVDKLIEETLRSINFSNIERHVRYLASLNRYTGYPGCEEAAEYIYSYLKDTLKLRTFVEEFSVAIPIDKGSSITVLRPERREIRAYALLPNHVQTCKGEYEGPLVYVGHGSLSELNRVGVPINGSIVLMEFNSRDNWLYCMRLGARAIIFTEPTKTIRSEAEYKNLDVPIKFPRLYVRREDGNYLKKLLSEAGNGNVYVRVRVNMEWENVKAKNIIAIINGTDPGELDNTIAIMAYYDADSVVPAVAPGADEACGIAALLEFARILKERPPKRPVWIIAFSGHNQAMAGGRDFIWHKREVIGHTETGAPIYFTWHYDHIGRSENKTLMPYSIKMAVSLDFSTDSDAVAILAWGTFYGGGAWYERYGYRDTLTQFLFTGGRYGRYYSEEGIYVIGSDSLRSRIGDKYHKLTYRVFGLELDRRYIQTAVNYEAAVFAQTGIWGICFHTALAARLLYGTPLNTIDNVNFENLRPQVEFSFIMLRAILDDTSWFDFKKVMIGGQFVLKFFTHLHRQEGGLGYAVVVGRVGRWDIRRNWYDYDWSGLLGSNSSYQLLLYVEILGRSELIGHRWIQFAEPNGTFVLKGLLPSLGWAAAQAEYRVLPFIVDKRTGDIVYAPDFGIYGTRAWPYGYTFFTFEEDLIDGSGRRIVNLAVFKAGAIAIHDLLDPRSLMTPIFGSHLSILDRTGVVLKSYSYMISAPPSFERPPEQVVLGDPASGYEAVIFVPEGTYVKVIFLDVSPIGLLTNEERGLTVRAGEYLDTAPTALRMVKDLLFVVRERVDKLSRERLLGVSAKTVREVYSRALEHLRLAEDALRKYRYGDYYAHVGQAWYYALLAYEETKSIMMDATHTIVLFFVLMLPFAFIFERLALHQQGRRRLISLLIILGASMFALYALHPGFKVAPYSLVSALGFVCFVLVVPVFILMMDEIFNILREIRRRLIGPYFVRVDRISSVLTAFNIGVENLRRRYTRTVLTVTSIILIVFSTLSFMALTPIWITEKRPPPLQPAYEWSPRYTGVLITRLEPFEPMNPMLTEFLKSTYGSRAVIAPRAYVPVQGIFLYNETGGLSRISGIFGFVPEEREVLRLHEALKDYIVPWFGHEYEYVCYITEDLAKSLSVKPGDYVSLYGIKLLVLGIIDQNLLRNMLDLDGQPIAPYDPDVTRPPRPRVYWGIVFIPYRLAIALGGVTISVAMKVEDKALVDRIARELSEYVGYYVHRVYAAEETEPGKSFLYSRRKVLNVSEWQFAVIPLLINSLLLISIMLGSLYERVKDIYVYTVVGLNPLNVAGIFLGEALVYAFLGAPLGYLLALGLGFLISPIVNYASSTIVISILISLIMVIISSAYPVIKSARLVTPSLERKWKPPTKPVGNKWDIPIPFSLSDEVEVRGVMVFVGNFLRAYGSEAQPFMLTDLKYVKRAEDGTASYEIVATVRLKPYEMGIVERAVLAARRRKGETKFSFVLSSTLLSGPRALWLANHLKLVDAVRKQVLLWKSIRGSERAQYIKDGERCFE